MSLSKYLHTFQPVQLFAVGSDVLLVCGGGVGGGAASRARAGRACSGSGPARLGVKGGCFNTARIRALVLFASSAVVFFSSYLKSYKSYEREKKHKPNIKKETTCEKVRF